MTTPVRPKTTLANVTDRAAALPRKRRKDKALDWKAAAGLGVGSAALLAALLYSKKR